MNYQRIYEQLIERSRTRIPPQGYIEHHHIIPKCMDGSDEKENIAILTPEEHFVAHVLLVKIYPEHKGLIHGVVKMCQTSKLTPGRKRRRLYGWLKRKHSEYMKQSMKGENNPNYGKHWKWIHKDNKNLKIEEKEIIPKGWKKGRYTTFYKRTCKQCEAEFITDSRTKKFCNLSCSSIFNNKQTKKIRSLINKESIWYTNGTKDLRLPKSSIVPSGFRKGRSKGYRGCLSLTDKASIS